MPFAVLSVVSKENENRKPKAKTAERENMNNNNKEKANKSALGYTAANWYFNFNAVAQLGPGIQK